MATTPIPTNCAAVTAALTEESGRFGPKIYSKSAWKSPIIRLQTLTNGMWENGLGDVHNILTYQRSFPRTTTADLWENVAPSDGDTENACRPPKTTIGFAQRTRTTRLRHLAVESPDFCIEDIRNRVMFAKQLERHTDILTDISWWFWRDRYLQDYYETAEHNVTINQAVGGIYDNGGNGYSVANPPNAQLEQSHLQTLALTILREGAENAPAMDVDTQEPVIELIIGKEMSDNLFINNAELLSSLRYAVMGNGLNADFLPTNFPKKRRVFGGFIHNIELYPRRFDIVGGVYVEIPVWSGESVTIGTGSKLNPDWVTAPYEEVIMWMPNVVRQLVPTPMSQPAPGWNFSPVDYMGRFKAMNILDRTCNPDGTQIYWRAIFSSAAEPIKPEVGVTLLANRCGYATRGVKCNYDSYY